MRRTIIDLRSDGAHVLPDLGATMHWAPPDELLQTAGAIPETECPEPDTLQHDLMTRYASAVEAAHKAATAEALGAYFDAVLAEGFEWGLAQRLLRMAFGNLKERERAPGKIILDLYQKIRASAPSE